MIAVYQAYGNNDIVEQALFSLATLRRFYPAGFPFEVRIYTDAVPRLQPFFAGEPNITLVPIGASQIGKWRGAVDFVHRVKLEILNDAARQSGDALVYVDTDTIFRDSPADLFAKISDQVSVMHMWESTLEQPSSPLVGKIHRFVRRRHFVVDSQPVRIAGSTSMWNAGVIGISAKNTALLDRMIQLTDGLYGGYRKHIMEQLAVSYYLQQATEVRTAERVVWHYWAQKEELQAVIHEFLGRHPTLAAATDHLSAFAWPEERAKPATKKRFDFFSLFRR